MGAPDLLCLVETIWVFEAYPNITGQKRASVRRARWPGRCIPRCVSVDIYDLSMTPFVWLHFSSVSYEGVDERAFNDRRDGTSRRVCGIRLDMGSRSRSPKPHRRGPSGPMLEAYTLLAALATKTDRVLLGSLVTPVTFRSPALLAKVVTTSTSFRAAGAVLESAQRGYRRDEAYGLDFPVRPSEKIASRRRSWSVVSCSVRGPRPTKARTTA